MSVSPQTHDLARRAVAKAGAPLPTLFMAAGGAPAWLLLLTALLTWPFAARPVQMGVLVAVLRLIGTPRPTAADRAMRLVYFPTSPDPTLTKAEQARVRADSKGA